MQTSPLRMIAPEGVSLAGSDIERIGQEPTTRATIFTVAAARSFKIDVSGTGSLPGSQGTSTSGAAPASGDDSDQPQVTEGDPKIYRHLPWLVTLALAILGVGLLTLFRRSPVRLPGGNTGAR
jgi:hypothetical protein